MNLEGKPEQFNIEKFKEDFTVALQKFADAIKNSPYHNRPDDDNRSHEERGEDYRANFYPSELEKLLPVALDALKKSDNKQEIFDEISKIFREIESDNTTGRYIEEFESPISDKDQVLLFEKIILNLLNS